MHLDSQEIIFYFPDFTVNWRYNDVSLLEQRNWRCNKCSRIRHCCFIIKVLIAQTTTLVVYQSYYITIIFLWVRLTALLTNETTVYLFWNTQPYNQYNQTKWNLKQWNSSDPAILENLWSLLWLLSQFSFHLALTLCRHLVSFLFSLKEVCNEWDDIIIIIWSTFWDLNY